MNAQQRVIKHTGFSGFSSIPSRIVVCHGVYGRSSELRHVSHPRPLWLIDRHSAHYRDTLKYNLNEIIMQNRYTI